MRLYICFAFLSCLGISYVAGGTISRPTKTEDQEKAVELLINRLLPGREKEFRIIVTPKHLSYSSLDSFELQTVETGILQITATSGTAASWGLNHYLKYFCKAHISWSGSQLNISSPLPTITKAINITSPSRLELYSVV